MPRQEDRVPTTCQANNRKNFRQNIEDVSKNVSSISDAATRDNLSVPLIAVDYTHGELESFENFEINDDPATPDGGSPPVGSVLEDRLAARLEMRASRMHQPPLRQPNF